MKIDIFFVVLILFITEVREISIYYLFFDDDTGDMNISFMS